MAQHATDNIEMMPDSPVAREDLGAGGTSRGAGARSPLFWKVLLLSVAVVWGYSFTTMKDALDTIPVFELLYVRFLPAALVMFFIFHKRIIFIITLTIKIIRYFLITTHRFFGRC